MNLLRRMVTFSIVSVAERGSTQGRYRVAHLVITAFIKVKCTEASMGTSSWIFLEDSKPAFFRPSLQSGWLTNTTTAPHVWRTVNETGFDYFEARNLSQNPFQNTLGAVHLHGGSNDNWTVDNLQTPWGLESSPVSLLLEVWIAITRRGWWYYSSGWPTFLAQGNVMLLNRIPPQVTAGNILITFPIVST
jgi:hypothetical protein